MDGTTTARMCNEILDNLYNPSFDHGSHASATESTPIPKPLDWELSAATTHAIEVANETAAELIEGQELGFHLTSYGKATIKKFGVSPDSWAQMIVQLAYHRLIGPSQRIGGTYEAATTRKFYKGRTEAIRVVTSESDAWVKSMDDESATTETRKHLFDQAANKHVVLLKAASQGQGVDRHLFALKKLLRKGEEEVPELFKDPVFVRSSYWVLSTSAIFSKHFPVYGWGEVCSPSLPLFIIAYMLSSLFLMASQLHI